MSRKTRLIVLIAVVVAAILSAAAVYGWTQSSTMRPMKAGMDKVCPFASVTGTAKGMFGGKHMNGNSGTDACCATKGSCPMTGSTASASKAAAQPTKVTDPVCGMSTNTQDAAGKSEYKGKTYYFCSTACKSKFDKDPGQYAK